MSSPYDDIRDHLTDPEDEPVDLYEVPEPPRQRRFLGMTAGERAFLSVVVFLNVLILGAAILIATGRIVL